MTKRLIINPIVLGLITYVLMQTDWLLALLQEKERKKHYFKHHQSYPINTIEGNPAFQNSVAKLQYFNPKHMIAALIIGIFVTFTLILIPDRFCALFIGYVLGMFLIVWMQHLINLTGEPVKTTVLIPSLKSE